MGTKDRKEREKAQKREKIIKVAEKLFFKKGFENTTMDEIAEKAEFSKGALYLYFKNKETLYSVIALRSMDILIKLLEDEVGKGKDTKERLSGIKNAYLRGYLEYKEHMRVLLFAFKYIPMMDEKEPSELMIEFKKKQAYFHNIIISAIKAAQEDNSMETIDVSIEELFMGGGIILESLFRQAFDMEELIKKQYKTTPEYFIRLAFKLLKF